MRTMSETVYTVKAINEFGHPVYQQTTDPKMARQVYTTWRRYVVTHAWDYVRIEPALSEDDG